MTDTAQLIAELRKGVRFIETELPNADGFDAMIDRADKAMLRAADRIASLEAALAPFAAQADRYDPPEDDDTIGIWGGTSITLGMLRAARTALSSSKQKGPGK